MSSQVLCGCKGCATARKPLQDTIQRVYELHKPTEPNGSYCSQCGYTYPCDTIQALDGDL